MAGHGGATIHDQRSYRCLRCERTYFVSHFDAEAQGGRPRCTFCGNQGDETPTSLARRGEGTFRAKAPASKRFACRECGERFRSGVACKLHEEERHGKPVSKGPGAGGEMLTIKWPPMAKRQELL